VEPLLKLENIRSGYGKIEVLRGISLEIHAGEIVTLIGGNGVGKTSTLMTTSRILPLRGGRIFYQNEDCSKIAPEKLVRRGLCQVPEGRRIFSTLTIKENLEMGAYLRKDKDGIRKDLEKVFEMFPILKARSKQLGGTLSGGEQQMLAISRALMSRPTLLMLDEPSLGLAPLIVQQIFRKIRELNQEEKMTILLVEQNANAALKLAHRAYVMETGHIVKEGQAKDLLSDPAVKAAYLGE
jgi:branched-chain amino acid transport system ATP-binding protein